MLVAKNDEITTLSSIARDDMVAPRFKFFPQFKIKE
jgi:hypothetical protein